MNTITAYSDERIIRLIHELAVHAGATKVIDEVQDEVDEFNKRAAIRSLYNTPTQCGCGAEADPYNYCEAHSPYDQREGFKCGQCGKTAIMPIYQLFSTTSIEDLRAMMLEEAQ